MLTEEEKETIKQRVYASTRYDNPQEEGNFPNPKTIDKLIEIETEKFNQRKSELEDRKSVLQADLDLLMNLSKEDIAELSPRVKQWLAHAIPKYKSVVKELEQEEQEETN